MVKVDEITLAYIQSCIKAYERETAQDIQRLFIPPINEHEKRNIPNVLIWNPNGCPKTTLFCPLPQHNDVELASTDLHQQRVMNLITDNRNYTISRIFFLFKEWMDELDNSQTVV